MSEQTSLTAVPEMDTADRMRKSLRHANLSVAEMARYLDVGRNTVSTWINGHIEPSTQTLRLWALRTGVDYGWLRTGQLGQGSRTTSNRTLVKAGAARARGRRLARTDPRRPRMRAMRAMSNVTRSPP